MPEETGRITIAAERGGTIKEICDFLGDLESAYLAIYSVEYGWSRWRRKKMFPFDLWMELGYPFWDGAPLSRDVLPPVARLSVERVRIESPGFWEFMASLNPLQQIREYLNDRHRRRQDREFREAAEKDKLRLENEIIRRQIMERNNSILRERISILREAGYSDDDVDRFIWGTIGAPMARLGRHQDTHLIGDAQPRDGQSKQ